MIKEGAEIIDIGGESTRPGSKSVSVEEELERVIPAIKYISENFEIPISIDTQKAEVAKKAYKDNSSLRDAIIALGYMSGEDFDKFVKPEEMVTPSKK